ncbi:toll/interleukin-1 receptor domain-containing protein [Enterobacter oligotrophicus]|uniref:toll/interleukin-1 receptor domain-containing protein n=1 Tax=Enterobacter oligotrophicus TaxID=2478464 RepID=UPI0023EFA2C7|nr:toll/interleukin-1 receptor domain-containing protein [Enterobacter oligotrophicus]
MSEKLIFLSHITEEKELAKIIKDAIEDEFAGFVRVFVSSDGETIRAGQNFLKVIEDGLVECCAAIYLISPTSVQRSWISFELGAVWIRNAQNQREGREEIPALPFCHSGMSFNALPQPICNLNAIEANMASKLEFAFKSLQLAVGARGRFRTDFNELASKIADFEKKYVLFASLEKIFDNLSLSPDDLKNIKANVLGNSQSEFTVNINVVPTAVEKAIEEIIQRIPAGLIRTRSEFLGMTVTANDSFPACNLSVLFKMDLLKSYFTKLTSH